MAGKGLVGLAGRAGKAAINWYPGHMASATKAIRERIKVVDLVLEIRDARKWANHFEACKQHHVFVNAHQPKSVKKMLDTAREWLKERLEKEPTLLLMIVGIPNVGKSALINSLFRLAHSSTPEQERLKKAKVGPLPGVTQDIAGFKIGERPSVYVLDTPGVLVPNIGDSETGLKLTLTGAVKDSVVGEERVARYLLSLRNSRSVLSRRKVELSNQSEDVDSCHAVSAREALAQARVKFDGKLEDEEDMESLVDAQMNVLRRLFKVPAELGEAGWVRVSKQLIKTV